MTATTKESTARETMKVAVCGPNISFRHRKTFEVHVEGCRDLKRGRCREELHPMIFECATRVEVCDAVYTPGEFECESGQYVDSEFHFAPCTKGLK